MKQESKVQVGVKSLIFNKEGKVLLLKRNTAKYPDANNPWDIPGGRIDADQTLEQNLLREIEEETGLSPMVIEIVTAQDIIKPNVRVIRLTYISHETSANAHVRLSDEHGEYRWLAFEDILGLEGLDSYVGAI